VKLAKRYGITTPYTSYLIVPDGPTPVVRRAGAGKPDVHFNLAAPGGFGGGAFTPATPPPALRGANGPSSSPAPVADFAKRAQATTADGAKTRQTYASGALGRALAAAPKDAKGQPGLLSLQEAKARLDNYREAEQLLKEGRRDQVQAGKLGVELSCDTNNLRNQSQLSRTAQRRIGSRNLLEIGGVWIDEAYDAKMPIVNIKTMSPAYFRMLERQPQVRDVFRIGNYLVWVTPNGTALVLDAGNGREQISDEEIDRLFVARK
jgi:Ca-activated chloride channel family protein